MTRNPSILHVEDDDAAAVLVQIALEELGATVNCHRVASVDTACDFLTRVSECNDVPELDLILLDLNLPKKSGHDVLAIVNQVKELNHVRVVVFTSSSFGSDRDKSLALGAFAYILKPTDYYEYLRAIRDVLAMIPEKAARTAQGQLREFELVPEERLNALEAVVEDLLDIAAHRQGMHGPA